MVNENGEVYYSKNLDLPLNDNAFNAVIIPNPASTNAKLDFYSRPSSAVEISLYNAQGKLLHRNNINTSNQHTSYELQNLDRLPAGIYFVAISDMINRAYLKLIKR
ncbi:MAG: T9SS type A sorting domain-containing protein [Panacibacter sp.]